MTPAQYPIYHAQREIEEELGVIKDALCAGLPTWDATQHALGVREGLERALLAVKTAQRKSESDADD